MIVYGTPEERWNRIATGLFWLGVLFIVFAGFELYDGGGVRAAAMTLAPAALLFGLWYLAAARRDQIAFGTTRLGLAGSIASGVLALVGVVVLVAMVIAGGEHANANNERERSLPVRVTAPPEAACVEWTTRQHPTDPTKTIEYCARRE